MTGDKPVIAGYEAGTTSSNVHDNLEKCLYTSQGRADRFTSVDTWK
jgi:hypothetical protein